MKRALPSGHNDLRVLLGRMETDMYMWSRGYEEVSPRLLDQLLHALQKTITLASDADDRKTLQNIVHQFESVRHAEPVDHQQAQSLAQQTIEDLRALRQRRTSPLHPVAVEEVVGAQVIYFYHDLSTIGQVIRFRPAGEKRAFGFIGTIIIRPCDEQKVMKEVFQGVYALGDGPVSNLYHWPADLPAQTFLDPGRSKDLVTIEWAEPRHEDEDEDEDEGYSVPPTPSLVQQAGDYLKSMLIRKRISAGDGDQRIGMPVYSLIQEQKGCLKSIQVHVDGSERWIADGQDGKEISHEGTFFWLEILGYHQLFPTRVLDQEDIYQHLREALALHEEQVELTESAELEDHDEIILLHRRLDRIQKFLNGDMEDEQKERIATVYQQMLWNSVSLDAAQREQTARQTAIEIDRLRQNKEKSGGALMTNEKDETAPYTIYVLDLGSRTQEADGIEVAATMKSLAHSLHEIIRGNRETTPEDIHYYFIKHVADLLQFARMATTITKLQMILKSLDEAKSALEQDEDAESLLRNAWQLMRSILSQEEIEKIAASQIELRRSGMEPLVVSGADAWEQTNHHLRSWSTTKNEDQRVEYVVSYDDGLKEGRWLNLPLFYNMHGAGEDFRIGPTLDLGNQVIAALEKSIDLGSANQASFEVARLEALAYLRRYKVGGSACDEAVTTAILKFQEEQWSPGIVYRRSLHTEHNRREGVLAQRVGGNLPLHATYTPSDEVAWGYHLYLAGIYDLQVVKRLATTGQEVPIQGAVQDTQTHQTRLDFSVLPGDEDPAIMKDGETVQITVLQAEAVIASMVFHREEDDNLTVETAGCDLIYLP